MSVFFYLDPQSPTSSIDETDWRDAYNICLILKAFQKTSFLTRITLKWIVRDCLPASHQQKSNVIHMMKSTWCFEWNCLWHKDHLTWTASTSWIWRCFFPWRTSSGVWLRPKSTPRHPVSPLITAKVQITHWVTSQSYQYVLMCDWLWR